MRQSKLARVILGFGLVLAAPGCTHGPTTQRVEATHGPPVAIKRLIADARAIAPAGDGVWPGYSHAPFGLVLVEDEVETAFCAAANASGFESLGDDAVTGCGMQVRARSFDTHFLATFPALAGVSTIVVGTPQATGLAPVEWTTTLLHEHFHQLQSAQAGYYDGVAALDLSGGDETGMWMLNYPFPYEDPDVSAGFGVLVDALDKAVQAIGTADALPARNSYLLARAALRDMVTAADWRYFEFQLWQEGVARWTEIAVSEAASAARPDLAAFAAARRRGIHEELVASRNDLPGRKRVAFYALGASEAMLLDAQGPHWRARYFREPFALGPYFQKAERR